MDESKWKKEQVWVARNEHGIIVRVSETPPGSWKIGEDSQPCEEEVDQVEMIEILSASNDMMAEFIQSQKLTGRYQKFMESWGKD
jgi:hypothetical protein